MEWLTLILLAAGLSTDAFAVIICDGMTIKKVKTRQLIFIAAVFGIMQGVMPLSGYYLGSIFINYIGQYLKWVSFVLLLLIGGKTVFGGIKSLRSSKELEEKNFKILPIIIQGVATSIDALAIGVSLLAFEIHILISAPVIASVTFVICLVGARLGVKLGGLMKRKNGIAEIIGGAVLIGLAIGFLFG
ncbi:MAG: manganese efflux pump MntP family protein [Clostridiales bacterium]|jgi:putative Mn2+ efflux pump MntP|nr:manganese efflux pump MntP family protein [Clostridiales bacterium]